MKLKSFPVSFALVEAWKFNCLLCTQEILFPLEKTMATHAVHHYITHHSVDSQSLPLLVIEGYLAIADFPNPAHIDEKEDEDDD